ncbi:uncharacterized protein LOC130673460 [Microplitis mediator]|uniref:uncharacterized protein LOC130673460 n=1 Tax=Microplitis mediator TaxID=375433 RepID=UPI00255409CC|nr:uncharacterized protein LOC130673460 [Microplitis mediator]
MAALFKVCRHDKPQERKIIKAASMDELISAAKNKLQLTNEKYKIYIEDFTDIDEDEILMDLANTTEGQLILTLVPDGIPWNNNALQMIISGPPTGNESRSQSLQLHSAEKATTSSNSSSSLLCQSDNLTEIFKKFSINVQSALKSGKTLEPKERKSRVHIVSAYMIYNLKNTSRKTAENISKQIINTYPKSFSSKIGDKNVDGAMEALRQTIYYGVNYEKGQSTSTSKVSFSLDDSDDESTEKPKAQDEYGCVSYLPSLPSSETLDTQEKKSLQLIEHYESSNDISNDDLKLISETYFLQRRQIHKTKDLTTFFDQWPHFNHHKVVIKHADLLLGKDTYQIWKKSIDTLAKPINCWSKNTEIYREIKDKKNKKKSTNPVGDERYARGILKSAKAHCDVVKNDEPYLNIIIGFIIRFMKEKEEYLYIFIDEDVDDDKLVDYVPVANPVLIIKGPHLFTLGNTYKVVIEKKIIIHVDSFLDGILTTFLSYYVFGFVYPKDIEGTLEAIQRLFLKICPPKGTKRGGKRKATNIHPKVTLMVEELGIYVDTNDTTDETN